jgi:hypothetical protein
MMLTGNTQLNHKYRLPQQPFAPEVRLTGRSNSLAKQVGEHLVCAELRRRDLLATPFAGNVPIFDLLAADERCRTVPIQVKATRGHKWPTDIRQWMCLEYDPQTGVQRYLGPEALTNSELIYVCVVIAAPGGRDRDHDRFFVLTQADMQRVIIAAYSRWMEGHGWKRPRKSDSFHCMYTIADVETFEDNWSLIAERLQVTAPDAALTDVAAEE